MKKGRFRKLLFILLGLSVLFAFASFVIPYEFGPDPGARFRIQGATIKRDQTNYWLTVHLKKSGDQPHDLQKPVRLLTRDGGELEPADTTFAGDMATGFDEIWFKFWLESSDLEGPLSLRVNDGRLKVRTSDGVPRLADKLSRSFITHYW